LRTDFPGFERAQKILEELYEFGQKSPCMDYESVIEHLIDNHTEQSLAR
jgi:hypothetical protein